jgi:cell division protein FtsW
MHRKSVYFLIVSVAILVTIGSVMLFSTSAFAKDLTKLGPQYILKRQIIWLIFGFVLCLVAANVDYHFWRRTWWVWFGGSLLLLTLCYVPPLGHRLNGSARWLNVGFTTFQPSEFAKFAAIVGLAWWYSRPETKVRGLIDGFAYPIAGMSLLLALIVFEVDMGTTALIGATMFIIMFVAGTRLTFLAAVAVLGIGGLVFAVFHTPERMGRILAFMYPERYPADFYQQLQGLIAFGSGGVDGLGLGNGRQKMAYLPYAYSDFIFPMIGEELGLRCTLVVVFCYLLMILCGTNISMHARDRFGMLLAFGIVVIIGLQAAVNIGVTTALLPNKGLTLPFISYGGSNLAFCALSLGILINNYRQGVSEKGDNTSVRLRVIARPKKLRTRNEER